jgi:hypothetical protein
MINGNISAKAFFIEKKNYQIDLDNELYLRSFEKIKIAQQIPSKITFRSLKMLHLLKFH